MRVLVVEDNVPLCALLAAGLQTAGFAADTSQTLAEARTALRSGIYAALILDLERPDHDGMLLLHELRQRSDPIAVVVLTARNGIDDRVRALEAGADDYLLKPFAIDDLAAPLSVQVIEPAGEGEFGRLDQPGIGDADPVDLAVEVVLPEIQELAEDWKFRRQVEVLPEEALQNMLVIGHPVEDLGGGDAIIVELSYKTPVHRALLDTTSHIA